METRYVAVIPESDDPWQRIPLALYRVEQDAETTTWWQLQENGRGWLRLSGPPAPGAHPAREVTVSEALDVLQTWVELQISPPGINLAGDPVGRPGDWQPQWPTSPSRPPRPRSERWQWRIFCVAMLVTLVVVVTTIVRG